jgi:hypothetical protein
MSSAVETLEVAAKRLMSAADDSLAAMNELGSVSPRLSAEAHRAACEAAEVYQMVKRALDALQGAGA